MQWVEVVKHVYFDEQLYNRLANIFGDRKIRKIFNAVKIPPKKYYVRVNLTKISREGLIEKFEERGLKAYEDEILEEAIYFKIKGPRKVPKTKKKIIVDKKTSESVLMGANVYSTGIINPDKMLKEDELNVLSITKEIIAFGIAKMDWNEVKIKKGLAIETKISRYQAPKIRESEEFKKGYFYIQTFPAMLTSKTLEPKENETIVDMCAAPGGKTTHVAELTNNKARIFAFDNSLKRIEELKNEVKRLGHSSIKIIKADSRYLDKDFPWIKADKVLLDPPCSALGVRPKIFERKTMKEILNISNYQKQFIKVAYRILKPSGILVYSTCTLTPEENELIIEYAKKIGFKVEEQCLYIGDRGLNIIDESELLQRFYPNKGEWPGYFIAKLKKL